jgi:SAM-dependent methyltransferase
MSDPAAAPGGDYNVVPYVSKPFPQSQPARLAALAHIFSLAPPDVSRARVLELGSAAGGNLIPHALRFPASACRGIDLSVRHVEEGQARIKALGLTNIRIEQGDIGALDLGSERFDYIVCHGVYSWVPPAVREAILEVAARHLADHGIAYVSYNVFPGWQMRNVIRDMMLYHAGRDGAPQMRIAKARWVIENVARSAPATPYGEMLRSEARLLGTMDDSYILGEFLADENAPVYFREFAARAESHGLAYLCEAESGLWIAENLGAEAGQLARTMSANGLIPLEQYMDFFRGRSFRQSLLVKAAHAPRIQRQLVPERLRDLHLAATLTWTENADGSFVFRGADGASLTTQSRDTATALQRLSEVYPETRTLPALAEEAGARTTTKGKALENQILDAIFKMVLVGLVEVSTAARRVSSTPGPRPRVSPLVRLDGAERQSWTTGPAHQTVALDVVSMALVPHLDGTNDRAALVRHLGEAVREGRVRLIDNQTGTDLAGPALAAALEEHVGLALGRLAKAGLLEV